MQRRFVFVFLGSGHAGAWTMAGSYKAIGDLFMCSVIQSKGRVFPKRKNYN